MKKAWIFIEKSRYGQIIKVRLYGSITKMAHEEDVIIQGKPKGENGLRYLLKENSFYEDADYHIVQMEINRNQKTDEK